MSAEMKDYRLGWESAQEDRAIGAGFGYPDATLSDAYRSGYVAGWNAAAADEARTWGES